MTATEQHQMLGNIWPRWLAVATSTGTSDQPQAEDAVRRLYEVCGQPSPQIRWIASLRLLPSYPTSMAIPLLCHFRETLIYSVWHKLADPTWVCGQIGFDIRNSHFRLPLNLRMAMSRTRVQDISRRPPWLVNTTNMVSQFDADALAVHELACGVTSVPAEVKTLGKILADLIEACFAAILFESHCLLVPKPTVVSLNPAHQLHAQRQAALQVLNREIFAVNGEIISVNRHPPRPRDLDLWVSPRRRVRCIEYHGWEEYFKEFERHAGPAMLIRIDKSKYGTLYRLVFHNQQLLVVRVRNRTREPDGSYRQFTIPVDRDCRPLPDPNRPEQPFGPPQELTALNAIASTFYMTGAEYAAQLGAES